MTNRVPRSGLRVIPIESVPDELGEADVLPCQVLPPINHELRVVCEASKPLLRLAVDWKVGHLRWLFIAEKRWRDRGQLRHRMFEESWLGPLYRRKQLL